MTDPARAVRTSPPPPGETLLVSVRRALASDYDVEREVGRGGMAVVFKAREKELERTVALKVLPPDLAPVATVAERFKREARLAASLDHPNIIPVYRVGQTGGVLYMAMKYIDGRALDGLVASQGPLPLPLVLTVLRATARAIAYAHEHGIVHRDIKGANILIDRNGRVVVSDFGIARAMESASLTATGLMVGTPHYMSPEQCAGKAAGAQSDQYSLGIVAYQLLTGTVPFDGESLPEILQQHCFTPPPDASVARPDSPAMLTAIVIRLLAKEPGQRFASTNDLVTALDSIPFTESERTAGESTLKALVRARSSTAPHSSSSDPGLARDISDPQGGQVAASELRSRTPSARDPDATVRTPNPSPMGPVAAQPSTAGLPIPSAPTRPLSQSAMHDGLVAPRPIGRGRTIRWHIPVAAAAVVGACLVAGFAVAKQRGGISDLSTVAEIRPSRPDASMLRQLGHRAYQAGNYELARRFYARAVRLDPSNPDAQEGLGCALLKLGGADSARSHFQAAHREDRAACR